MEMGRGVYVRPDILHTRTGSLWKLRGECDLTLAISHSPQKGESGEYGTERAGHEYVMLVVMKMWDIVG